MKNEWVICQTCGARNPRSKRSCVQCHSPPSLLRSTNRVGQRRAVVPPSARIPSPSLNDEIPSTRNRNIGISAATVLAVIFIIAVVTGPHPTPGTGVATISASDSPDTASDPTDEPTPAIKRPAWAQLIPGVHAYTKASNIRAEDNFVKVCPTVTDFTEMREMHGDNCVLHNAGQSVVVHKTDQDPGIFGGDAAYVIAKTWSGLVDYSDLTPIVPKGTLIVCPENDDYGWTLYLRGYGVDDDNRVSLGRSAFKAIVRHTLEPTETLGPAFHILSGGGPGKDGYLLFKDIADNCHIDGTSYNVDFDS